MMGVAAMCIFYNESSTKQDKKSFINNGYFSNGETRSEIAQSWERSKNFKLDHTKTLITLPSKSEKNKVGTMVTDYLRDYILPNIISNLYDSLETHNGALFYAYENGVVFSQRGNKAMLKYLNSLNLGIGSCIAEEYIGTTSIALVKDVDQEAWVIGEEHYLDILTPYATHCFCSNNFNEKVYTFIILPKGKFTKLFLSYARMFHNSWKAEIESYRNALELYMKNEIYDQLVQSNDKAILFIDNFGKIITANDLFVKWFQVDLQEIKQEDCIKLFPGLEKALSCLDTGKKINFEEIIFENAPNNKQFMRMDVIPMNKNEQITGLSIVLQDSISIRNRVNKSSHTQAYYTFDKILGESGVMKTIKQKACDASYSTSSIILTGESGTGKELFAQSIHNESPRRNGPFVAMNCATVQPELIASELFGYVDGAFTGAKKGGSMGKFEYADQGTIFLDEVGELPLFAQTMLLRVLEERTVTRVGSNISTPIDVRVISATNRDLKKMVKEGTFRLDLYYRINVIHLHLPPLRERITDIPLLIDYNLQYFNRILNKRVTGVSPEALSRLVSYSWPGNLRELRNMVEYSINITKGETLKLNDLPSDILDSFKHEVTHEIEITNTEESDFHSEERKRIIDLMLKYNGNKSHVAEKLGISRNTLYKRLKTYKIS